MNRMNKFLVVGLLFGLFALVGTSAEAVVGWYTCDVVYVGPANDLVYFRVSDTAATPAWSAAQPKLVAFDAASNAGLANRGLAIILTAVSNEDPIYVQVDPDVGWNTPQFVNKVYLDLQ